MSERWPESNWDHDEPKTVADVVALLRRRADIHRRWADWIRREPERARPAVDGGNGTVESHERYARQYESAISVLEALK